MLSLKLRFAYELWPSLPQLIQKLLREHAHNFWQWPSILNLLPACIFGVKGSSSVHSTKLLCHLPRLEAAGASASDSMEPGRSGAIFPLCFSHGTYINFLETLHQNYLSQSRQYRDFVTLLPEAIAIEILSYVPGKDILSKSCMVYLRRQREVFAQKYHTNPDFV